MRGEFDNKNGGVDDIEMSNTDPTYTGPDPDDVENGNDPDGEAPGDTRALQHQTMVQGQAFQAQPQQRLVQVAQYPPQQHPHPGPAPGGVSWGADVRQIDRTGQTLECIESDTVVSGLTMPTWSAQRPWEAPMFDTPYDDQQRPVVDRESVSYRTGASRQDVSCGGDGNGGTVKTHWTFWGKPRNRRLCIPFLVLGVAAIGVVVGVMLGGQNKGGDPSASQIQLNNPSGTPGDDDVMPTMAPSSARVGGINVGPVTPSSEQMPTSAPSTLPTSTPSTASPTATPTLFPTVEPGNPTKSPTTKTPTVEPTKAPTAQVSSHRRL